MTYVISDLHGYPLEKLKMLLARLILVKMISCIYSVMLLIETTMVVLRF